MIIVEFSVDHPILRRPLNTIADLTIEWEHTYNPQDGPTQTFVWVETDDIERFETAVDSDSTIADAELIDTLEDRRLYCLEFTEYGTQTVLSPRILAVGGMVQNLVGTAKGWQYRVQLPSREPLDEIVQFCHDQDIELTIDRLYEEAQHAQAEGINLTEPQREILLEAAASGYLAIPRECTLAELGNRLGISESAASERFRRGVQILIEQTLKYPSA